jgi:formylglycine-generating enzyme required for sulfatase activity
MPKKTVRHEDGIPAVFPSPISPTPLVAGPVPDHAVRCVERYCRGLAGRILVQSSALFLAALFLLATGCGRSENNTTANQETASEARSEMAAVRGRIKSAGASYLKEVLHRGETLEKSGGEAMEARDYAKALSSFTEARKCYRQAVDLEAAAQTKHEAALAEKNSVMAAKAAADEAFKTDARPESFLAAGTAEKEAEDALAREDYAKAQELFARAVSGYKTAQAEAGKFMRDEVARPALTAKKEAAAAKAAANAVFRAAMRPESFLAAGTVEKEAEAALAREELDKARELFDRAAGQYKSAQSEGEALNHAEDSRAAHTQKKEADAERVEALAAFRTEARPESFVNAENCAKEGEAALARQDFAKAREFYVRAFEGYKAARTEAMKIYKAEMARAAWSRQVAAADAMVLEPQAVGELAKLKVRAESAAALMTKDPGQAGEELTAATTALKELIAGVRTRANLPKSGPVVAQVENALRAGDWLRTQWTLGQLEQLIPSDPRMADFRAKATALPWPKELSLDLGGGVLVSFVYIAPGSFEMGEGSEKHKVTLTKPFYMGRYEVTQQQWQAVMGNNPSGSRGDKNPVENISWNDSQRFATRLNEKLSGVKVLLPTEAQWEYACRAGSTTRFGHGDDEARLVDYAWHALRGYDAYATHPVGAKKPNGWGLFDMHGNVAEFCSDWFGPYPVDMQEDPQGPASGSEHVWRGGSCRDFPSELASGSRKAVSPENVLSNGGFRLVLVTDAIAEYQAGLIKYPNTSPEAAAPASSTPVPSAPPPLPPVPTPTARLTMPSPPPVATGPAQPDDWMKWLPPQALPGFVKARNDAKAGSGLFGMRSWRAMWGNRLRDPARGFVDLEFAELLLADSSKESSASAEALKKQQNLKEATMMIQALRARNITDPALLNRLEETAKKLP